SIPAAIVSTTRHHRRSKSPSRSPAEAFDRAPARRILLLGDGIVAAVTLKTLVDTNTLAARLDDPDTVVVDSRFDLADESAGQREYTRRHVPGSVYAH